MCAIAVLTTVHNLLDARIFYKESGSLAKAGYDVTVVASEDADAIQEAENLGLKLVFLRSDGQRSSRWRLWWQLYLRLRHTSFVAWHFHDPELLLICLIFKFMLRSSVKLIYDVHEDVPKQILDKAWIPKWLRSTVAGLFHVVELSCAKKCSLIVCATEGIAKKFDGNNVPCIVVRNFPTDTPTHECDRELASCPSQPTNRVVRVIYSGGVSESRGIYEMLEAMAYLQDLPVELVILGEFATQALEMQVRNMNLCNVRLLGKVPFREVMPILTNCDIGIVCLQPLERFQEALPVKLFEYMQAGLPVIASNFPLWTKIVDSAQCGVLVDPTQPILIADAIRSLVTNTKLRQEMQEAARFAISNRFSWQAESKVLLKAYRVHVITE